MLCSVAKIVVAVVVLLVTKLFLLCIVVVMLFLPSYQWNKKNKTKSWSFLMLYSSMKMRKQKGMCVTCFGASIEDDGWCWSMRQQYNQRKICEDMIRDTCNSCGNFNLFGARLEIIKKGE